MSLASNLMIPTTPVIARVRRGFTFVECVAGVAALAASFVLITWFAHLDGVMRLLPGTIVTKPNGALALLLVAVALMLTGGWHIPGRRRTAAQLLALACLAVAGATTFEWLAGINLGIDQALVTDWSGDLVFPGRPTLIGSAALTLLGIAILAGATSTRLGRIRDTSALMVMALGLLSIGGLATRVVSFGTAGQIAPASVSTAIGVTICAAAVLVAGNSGTFALLVRKGPAGTIARGLTVASVIVPLALGAVASAAERDLIIGPHVATAFIVVGTMYLGVILAMLTASVTNRHLDEMAAATTALRTSEQRQRLLIENLPQAIVFKNLDGIIVSANQSVRTQLGLDPEALVGKRLEEVAPPGIAAHYADHKRAVLETHQATVFVDEVELSGGLRFVEVRTIPALDDTGSVVGLLLMISDITEQRERERDVRLLASIVDSTDDAIMSGNTQGLVTSWNASATRLYGWTAEEAIGAQRTIIVPPEMVAASVALTDAAIGDKQVVHVETVRVAKDGRRIDVQLTVSSVLDETGGIAGYSLIARDISARKRDQAMLERTRQELERSNRELQDFASVASHDLQEPLRKIRAFGDRLERRVGATLDADSRDDIVRIQGAAARMQQLIEDLLTYARVTSRAQPFKPVALGLTAASVVEDLETSIGESHGQVFVGGLPTIEADASQMRQLFQNLIGNGLKFHPPERAPIVTLSATATTVAAPDGAPRAGWLIDVADNGIGFEPRFADRIFAPFERLHSRAEFPGTGIGLAICRKIAARHGGTITVGSTPGTGTTFHVLLPTAQALSDPIQPAAPVAITVAPEPHATREVAAAVPA